MFSSSKNKSDKEKRERAVLKLTDCIHLRTSCLLLKNLLFCHGNEHFKEILKIKVGEVILPCVAAIFFTIKRASLSLKSFFSTWFSGTSLTHSCTIDYNRRASQQKGRENISVIWV